MEKEVHWQIRLEIQQVLQHYEILPSVFDAHCKRPKRIKVILKSCIFLKKKILDAFRQNSCIATVASMINRTTTKFIIVRCYFLMNSCRRHRLPPLHVVDLNNMFN